MHSVVYRSIPHDDDRVIAFGVKVVGCESGVPLGIVLRIGQNAPDGVCRILLAVNIVMVAWGRQGDEPAGEVRRRTGRTVVSFHQSLHGTCSLVRLLLQGSLQIRSLVIGISS